MPWYRAADVFAARLRALISFLFVVLAIVSDGPRYPALSLTVLYSLNSMPSCDNCLAAARECVPCNSG